MFTDIYSVSYKMRRQLYRRISTAILSVFLCVLLINLVRALLFYPVLSKTDSMSPAISSNSVVLVAPFLKNAERGQVMLVNPLEKENHSFVEKTFDFFCRFVSAQQYSLFNGKEIRPLFRRVVGLPGDTIYISNYLVYIKPAGKTQFLTEFELTKIKYTLTMPENSAGTDSKIGAIGNMESITLGNDEYFVLADNRFEGFDSRLGGPVKADSFAGKALLIYFPFSNIKIF